MKHTLFVIVGPSGIGKSYLMHELVARQPEAFVMPPLLTTRVPRPGEQARDRQFISAAEYQRMLANGEFGFADTFYGNLYGYTHEALEPKDKNILINALPPMIAEFSKLPAVCLVGMTIAADNLSLIERRLQERGDPSEAIEKRLTALKSDIETMDGAKDIFAAHGQLFEITGDDTIPDKVVPFIVAKLA